MRELSEITFNIAGFLTLACLIISNLLYLILTSLESTRPRFFSYDFQIGAFLIYDKEVDPKYEWIKKMRNYLLVIGARLFLLVIVLLCIKAS